jgi:ferric-dicitrate binding protein FerR (iron transport regulator)
MTDRAGDIATLIKKHIHNELTDNEKDQLTGWISESEENQKVFDELTNERTLQQAMKDLYEFKQARDNGEQAPVVSLNSGKTNWIKYTVAAATIIAVVGMVWLFTSSKNKGKQIVVADTATTNTIQDIAPGGNKAVLTLADGKTIILDSAHNGLIAEQGNTAISKKQDGELAYDVPDRPLPKPAPLAYNTVSTPRGGQYQLTLPDGSKVWLNAASSLKFPVSFIGNERTVQLSGEAYFEVAHATMPGSAERMPFIVEVNNGMKVQVLGTWFNIMAYEEEKETKTTLLQGKVKVIREAGPQGPGGSDPAAVYLQPGQQALLANTGASLRVLKEANVAEAVAWKNGLFKFEHTDLKTVMRQLARWYDVQIEYAQGVPEKYFSGDIPRKLNASEALSVIEFTGVHCKIEGKKIKVLP